MQTIIDYKENSIDEMLDFLKGLTPELKDKIKTIILWENLKAERNKKAEAAAI